MKYLFVVVTLLLSQCVAVATIRVGALSGSAAVRHGVSETWTALAPGDTLRQEDAIRTGTGSSISISLDRETRIAVPENVLLEVSDLRQMTQEELLLKLAMNDIRSIPAPKGNDNMDLPRTTTLHGSNRGEKGGQAASGGTDAGRELNGAKFLYDEGYYATSVLRSKAVFQRDPVLAGDINARFRVAGAFERIGLTLEALNEYREMEKLSLDGNMKKVVQDKITTLRKKRVE